MPVPIGLAFLEEREAFRRAQFAAFLHILHTDDMGLWFKFLELLLAKIRCGEETRTPDPTFVSRVTYHLDLWGKFSISPGRERFY